MVIVQKKNNKRIVQPFQSRGELGKTQHRGHETSETMKKHNIESKRAVGIYSWNIRLKTEE